MFSIFGHESWPCDADTGKANSKPGSWRHRRAKQTDFIVRITSVRLRFRLAAKSRAVCLKFHDRVSCDDFGDHGPTSDGQRTDGYVECFDCQVTWSINSKIKCYVLMVEASL